MWGPQLGIARGVCAIGPSKLAGLPGYSSNRAIWRCLASEGKASTPGHGRIRSSPIGLRCFSRDLRPLFVCAAATRQNRFQIGPPPDRFGPPAGARPQESAREPGLPCPGVQALPPVPRSAYFVGAVLALTRASSPSAFACENPISLAWATRLSWTETPRRISPSGPCPPRGPRPSQRAFVNKVPTGLGSGLDLEP
jgi:hypothetical protein